MKAHKLLTASIVSLATAVAAGAQTAPSVVVVEPVKNAGIVRSRDLVRETFTLRNQGTAELKILSVEPDCGCTVVSFDRAIAPGGSGEIVAEVNVSSFVGPIAKYLSVLTNDSANPQLALTIKAEVRPLIQIFPGYARFLTVEGDGEMRAELTAWASERDDFEIVSARSPYPFVDVEYRRATEDEERSEGQGQQWRVILTLSKSAPVGPMARHVILATNHPKTQPLRIPVSGFVRPVLAVSPPVADLGARDGSQPITASVHVKNFSDDDIALLSATSDLPGLDVRIKPEGRDNYLILTLQPGLAKGEFSGTMTVQTDSSRVRTLTIEVKGTIL